MPETLPPGQGGLALLVTGLSGAGKSTALKAFEDLGFEAVDNLPLSLLAPLLAGARERPLAIGIDVRTRAFDTAEILRQQQAFSAPERPIRILFFDCADEMLQARFSETRRRHPLAGDRAVADGIALERELLAELRRNADMLIDTTERSPNDLRRLISERFGRPDDKGLAISILSFGYARGLPRDADLVFDMRFLANPHWVAELRPMTGRDPEVAAHIEADPEWQPRFGAIVDLLLGLLPAYQREGRSYLTIAFGCTGGRHRSVAAAEAMAQRLAAEGWTNSVTHRDIDRTGSPVAPRAPAEGLE
jgi:RNase adaptor protein for sRNA GlmZ degradation